MGSSRRTGRLNGPLVYPYCWMTDGQIAKRSTGAP